MLEILLRCIIWLLIIVSVFYFTSAVFNSSSHKMQKTLKQYFKRKDKIKKDSVLDNILNRISLKFAKYINLSSVKYSKYHSMLSIAGINKTPEVYFAYLYTSSGIFVLIGLFLLIFNFFGAVVIGMGVFLYFYQINELKKINKNAVEDIERELPKFVAFIHQIMNQRPSALSILQQYQSTNDVFAKELSFCIADITTSDFVSGIKRFEQRIGSHMLKETTDGLISIYNGTYDEFYFAMLERDFTTFEINNLKKEIKKIPAKMQMPKILMVLSVMVTLTTPLIFEIIKAAGDLFST